MSDIIQYNSWNSAHVSVFGIGIRYAVFFSISVFLPMPNAEVRKSWYSINIFITYLRFLLHFIVNETCIFSFLYHSEPHKVVF